jgi:hypothetical protein
MVYQNTVDGCGKASVRNLLAILFREESFLTEPLASDCRNLLEIRKELQRYDCVYVSFEVNSISQVDKCKLPAIALVRNMDVEHFVVIRKVSKGKVSVVDPQFGEYILTYAEFEETFLHRMLLLDRIGPKQPSVHTSLFLIRERISYVLCFVFQAVLLSCLIISTGIENGFVYTILLLVGLVCLIVLQNTLNNMVQTRLEKEVMKPYLSYSRSEKDFVNLNSYFSKVLKRRNQVLSYGLITYGMILLLSLNSYFLSILALIPLLMTFLRRTLKKERNKVNRYCSFEEKKFMMELKYDNEDSFRHFDLAKKKGYALYFNYILTYLMEGIMTLTLILFELTLLERMNVNMVAYYLCLCMSLSFSIGKLFDSFVDREEEFALLNDLTIPLSLFLLKTKADLKYNISHEGVRRHGTAICPRIYQSIQSQGSVEKNLPIGFAANPEDSTENGEISCITDSGKRG